METRANYLAVGIVTLALLVGAVVFVLWLIGVGQGPTVDTYRIYFRGAVDGLGTSSDVRYNGIKVGTVSRITLDREDPSRVEVLIGVDHGTPVREDSLATLSIQGITGVSYIQITSGAGNSPPLLPAAGETIAVIPSRQAVLQEAIQSLPDLLNRSSEVLANINKMAGEENQQKLSAILDNVEGITGNIKVLTGALADRVEPLQRIIDNLDKGSSAFGNLATSLNGMSGDARKAVNAIEKFAVDLRDLLVQNRQPINEFMSNGMSQFTRLVAEARQMVATLSRIGTRVESDPARFLLGSQRPEYSP